MDIKQPITDAEKTKTLKDSRIGEDTVFVHVHSGQNPTLTEMFETIIWAATDLSPLNVDFTIDSTYTGEEEYAKVFQYLKARGFEVHAPGTPTVTVPVFDESATPVNSVVLAPDETHSDVRVTVLPELTTEDIVPGNASAVYQRLEPLVEGVSLSYRNDTARAVLIGAGAIALAILLKG